jgi:hypothetical protein
MNNSIHRDIESVEGMYLAPASSTPLALPTALPDEVSGLLQRMFRDPRVLQPEERSTIVAHLTRAVELEPHVPEIRVLLGMALSVDLQVQEAMEQLRESTRQAPDCYIAQLKFGELLMRLRICDQAAEHTQRAAELASNDVQADLARRQATTIRTMRREGIERSTFGRMLPAWMIPASRKSRKAAKQQNSLPVPAGSR